MKAFIKKHARFIVAGIALIAVFGLSIEFNNRGFQWDLEGGGPTAEATPGRRTSDHRLAKAEVVNKVVMQLLEKYVDPSRIEPNRMFLYGLDEIQTMVPEVVIEFDRDIDDNPRSATVSAGPRKQTFKLKNLASLWDLPFQLLDVFAFLERNLSETETRTFADIEYGFINGMLHTLDPHSLLLRPKVYKEMQTQTGGEFGGLGIVIGVRDEQLTVISPIDDTPASRAGIKAGDLILRINEESTVNMTLTDAVSRLRGQPGTDVVIWVNRKGWTEARKIEVQRELIPIESVESHMLAGKIGYLKLKSFQSNTSSDMKAQLGELNKQSGGINGLVLDLRGNPGGLLDQAIKVSDTFIKDGTLVSTVGYGNKTLDEKKATERHTEPDYPIVVLLDEGSASASEIVAGALKNHNRALVVGDRSFGKGSVQIIYDLKDGSAVKLTIAQYLTPGNVSIQGVGITPDIEAHAVSVRAKNLDLYPPLNVGREADLESSLRHKTAKAGDKPAMLLSFLRDTPTADDKKAEENEDTASFDEDFLIRLGQKLLKASGRTHDREEMISQLRPVMEQISNHEMSRITAELDRLGVDWTAANDGVLPELEVKVKTSGEGAGFMAGEMATIDVEVTNQGNAAVYRLRAVSNCDTQIFDDREFVFGRLEPGETRTWKMEVELPDHYATRRDLMKLDFDADGIELDLTEAVEIKTVALPQPRFAFSYHIDDRDGNGDGVLQSGERVKVKVTVFNQSDIDSGKTTTYLNNKSGSALFLKEGRATVDAIPAGSSTSFDFQFDVKSIPNDGAMHVELEVVDDVTKAYTVERFDLAAEDKASQEVAAQSGSFVPTARTVVRVAARDTSHPVAHVGPGSALTVTAKSGAMLAVDLGQERMGWVKASEGTFTPGDQIARQPDIETVVLRAPPKLKWQELAAFTDQPTYSLKGLATDEHNIQDYYVFVTTRSGVRYKGQKVLYRTGGEATMPIDGAVPLQPGLNRIRVTVRDDDEMEATETLYVYRK